MADKKTYQVIITDQPPSGLLAQEYISKTKREEFDVDIKKLISSKNAEFHGRAWSKVNGAAYQIFTLDAKRVLVEDVEATAILKSMFDTDGRLREVDIK
jgi:hypothetical protein